MNELLKRGVTGVIYVLLLLSAIMLNSNAFDFLFLVFGLICIFEFKRIVRLSNYRIFIAFLVMWWLFIHIQIGNFIKYILLISVVVTDIVLMIQLFMNDRCVYLEKNKFLVALLYIGGGCIFIPLLYQSQIVHLYSGYTRMNLQNIFMEFPREVKAINEAQLTMIAILSIIWASDTFAYIVGKNFGKHKLFPVVSPKKTVEGFLGGLAGAMATAMCFYNYSDKPLLVWVILALTLIIMGTIGDLVESKFKRIGGKKDSGKILPGHGGLLDRLDSLIFSSPFAYLVLEISYYVS